MLCFVFIKLPAGREMRLPLSYYLQYVVSDTVRETRKCENQGVYVVIQMSFKCLLQVMLVSKPQGYSKEGTAP